MTGRLGNSQPVVCLTECVSKDKSGLGCYTEHISIVVFTHTEQMQVYKPHASVAEPMCCIMQVSSLPRADPAMPSHPLWA